MAFTWTDTEIQAKETLVRKIHIDEVRSNVDELDTALDAHVIDTNYAAHPIVTAEHNGLMTTDLYDTVVARDADTVDGYHADDLLSTMPIGAIIAWPNEVIPLGFQLCDGTNGTPDLRDKFIFGAGPSHAVHTTGGEATHVLTEAETASHRHVGLTYTGTGYDNQHEWAPFISSCRTGPCPGTYCPDAATGYAGGNQAHNNLPPYHCLYFIQKITGKMPTYEGDIGPNADRLDGYHAADFVLMSALPSMLPAQQQVHIATGVIVDGGVIPLPPEWGVTRSQCHHFVSINYLDDAPTSGDLYSIQCSVDQATGAVYCRAENIHRTNYTANYMIIAIA